MTTEESTGSVDFVRAAIDQDIADGRFGGRVHTRFPPEPNGYLHIGHAMAICLDFGVAHEYGGMCNLRFDDTNPTKEDVEFVHSQQEDIRWLGFDWEGRLFYASDYFEQLFEFAMELIRDDKAYVDSLSADEIREYRGTLTEPGRNSPHRDRDVEESLSLFRKMRNGDFDDGEHVVRAKIDMASPNMNMRDPTIYRIRKVPHDRTGDEWCVYPMYDFAHPLSDAIEGITHSLCSLEYEDHRPLYEWFLEQLDVFRSRQIEFARLNLSQTVMHKRMLIQLVNGGLVSGWDDPRMPTIAGLRRRGYTPEAIKDFCARVGVAKANSIKETALLEHCLRNDLNVRARRKLAVLHPLRVVIKNYPEGQVEYLDAVNNPEDADAGVRQVPFSRTILVERNDFMEDPPRRFYRLSPGREVRLRYGYFIKCEEVIKNDAGEVLELRCTYDPETRGGSAPDGRKVRATLHWVSEDTAVDAEVRLYDHMFEATDPSDVPEGVDWRDTFNRDSLEVLTGCKVEPSVRDISIGQGVQFERQGYFCLDNDSTPDRLVFNRTVPLRDTWARIQRSG
ncbi:MAG: glutamine--tRNA ligase/YqeY domain fusion protein [SAR202 cluster bacterium]|nr:glutamine--tRNA ligase/YqeY domain fusion protein [SAR202 cluster bacterium]MDP7224197.1 glutamine--tRNA ligase/YqeY domain fusion protein [SAR202 cluster bacterium]